MLTFLFFSALVIAALSFGAVVFVPLMIIGLVIWLITLPFRLVFALVGGLVHAVFALLFLPFRLLRRFA